MQLNSFAVEVDPLRTRQKSEMHTQGRKFCRCIRVVYPHQTPVSNKEHRDAMDADRISVRLTTNRVKNIEHNLRRGFCEY